MKTFRLGAVVATFLLLGGCGNGGDSGSEPEAQDESVFDPMVDTIDRAEAIEGIGLERKDQMDELMDGE
jgi:hypothetical protein